jgi:hypothetical protein
MFIRVRPSVVGSTRYFNIDHDNHRMVIYGLQNLSVEQQLTRGESEIFDVTICI